MIPDTASSLELTWSGVALCGAVVALALLAHIWTSYRAVEAWIAKGWAYRWGPRHKFALGFLLGIGLLLLVWCGFVALGANAILNPPPITPDREAASERAGWILVGLETVLFAFQAILMWAWVAVGAKTLRPARQEAPTLGELVIRAIDAGREMGHAVAKDLQPAVALLDELARDDAASPEIRARAAEALAALDQALVRVRSLHAEIKALEPTP